MLRVFADCVQRQVFHGSGQGDNQGRKIGRVQEQEWPGGIAAHDPGGNAHAWRPLGGNVLYHGQDDALLPHALAPDLLHGQGAAERIGGGGGGGGGDRKSGVGGKVLD